MEGKDKGKRKGRQGKKALEVGPLVLLLAFILLGLLYVGFRIQAIELRYRISEAREENKELKRVHEQLLLEVAVLRSPSRIAEIATKELGMSRPTMDQIIVIR